MKTTRTIYALALWLGVALFAIGAQGNLLAQEEQPKPHEAQEQEAKPEKPEKQETPKAEQQQAPKDEKQDKNATKEEKKEEKNEQKMEKSNAQTNRAEPAPAAGGGQMQAGGKGGHIPDNQFHAHFGRSHTFVVNKLVVVNNQPSFVYGGYSFILVDPWPVGWAYTDQCYVDYIDGEYFLFDLLHPGVRIALFVSL